MPLVNGLPEFLRFTPAEEGVRIIDDGKKFHPAGMPEQRFEFPSEVYDYIHDELGKKAVFPVGGFSRHESHTKGRKGDGGRRGMFFEANKPKDGHRGSSRLLMSYDPHLEERITRYAYKAFLKARKRYLAKPKVFINAYEFVSNHPLFWSYIEYPDGKISWNHDGFATDENPLDVYRRKGKTVFLVEPTFYENHQAKSEGRDLIRVLDTNLPVVARSYEQAIIRVAKRLEKYYDKTGALRKNVADTAYTKSLMAKLDMDKEPTDA